MFASPCTFRSAQCAALIALAAVAGIARVEAPVAAETADAAQRAGSSFGHLSEAREEAAAFGFFQLDRTAIAPWAQRVVAFAFRFFAPRPTETHAAVSTTASSATASAVPSRDLADPLVPLAAPVAVSAYAAMPRQALCTGERILPFAVGPPRGEATNHPSATDTEVSRNAPAHGLTIVECIASPAGVAADARLARLQSPKPNFAGLHFPSHAAAPGGAQRTGGSNPSASLPSLRNDLRPVDAPFAGTARAA